MLRQSENNVPKIFMYWLIENNEQWSFNEPTKKQKRKKLSQMGIRSKYSVEKGFQGEQDTQ